MKPSREDIEGAKNALQLVFNEIKFQGLGTIKHEKIIKAGETIRKTLEDALHDGWLPIESCPKVHGLDYVLWDKEENEERVTWFGNGEWNYEGNYTHWRPLSNPPKNKE